MAKCVVIPCCGPKQDYPCPAAYMYISDSFKAALSLAKRCLPDDIYIFSAKHGLLSLDTVIEPYCLVLWHNSNMKITAKNKGVELPPVADKKIVLDLKKEANKKLEQYEKRLYLMSNHYCRSLVPGIQPLKHLRFGEARSFLKNADPAEIW